MPTAQFRLLVFGAIACAAAGCHTVQHRGPQERPDIVHYNSEPPVWVFIPSNPWDATDRRGYPAQIAVAPVRYHTTNYVEVTVGGEVVSEGTIPLHRGGTVLQAVSRAGGFTDFALVKRLRL